MVTLEQGITDFTHVRVGDDGYFYFGDDKDVKAGWDGSVLKFLPVADDTGAINIGDGSTDLDVKVFLGSASEYVLFDVGNSNIQFIQVPIQQTLSGTGYSLNFIDVTSDTESGNTRGWRVNVTTAASIAHGDLQCVHGYLTLGSSATLAANAAVYPLSSWIDIPDSTTVGNGAVIAGLRVIFDPNNNDLSTIGGGGESALMYAQTWASTGTLDHGLALVAGAGTTINNLLHLGGSGTVGKIFDFTEWPDATQMVFMVGGPAHSGATAHFQIAMGRQTAHAGIVGEIGASDYGSLYVSVATGQLFQNKSGTWTEIS